MDIIHIESASNPLIKRIRGMTNRVARRKSGLFLIEGIKVVQEALEKDLDFENLVVSKSFFQTDEFQQLLCNACEIHVVEDRLFQELSDTQTPQGVLALVRTLHTDESDFYDDVCPLVLILDRIQDPGNLGTIFRTALSFSASGIYLCRGTVDPYNPKVIRAASGALFTMPFISGIDLVDAIVNAKENGLKIVALSADTTDDIASLDLKEPTALILGNEGQGIEKEARELVDINARIPISAKSESLNVAIANAIALYEVAMQRATASKKLS
ncbi:MAG: RNA methyltransferase [Candidatus Obscuribacterales bacterium]|nr:RNA methyltransferase [Candidatus Obscuribacterales bacterium]